MVKDENAQAILKELALHREKMNETLKVLSDEFSLMRDELNALGNAAEQNKLEQNGKEGGGENAKGTMQSQAKIDTEELEKGISSISEELKAISVSMQEQRQLFIQLKDALPHGNQFEEVVKHADLINQNTAGKLDALSESISAQNKTLSSFSGQFSQLPNIMQNLNSALTSVVEEMKKEQMTYKALESRIIMEQSEAKKAQNDIMQKVEALKKEETEQLNSLESRLGEPKKDGGMRDVTALQLQLEEVLSELRKFELSESEKMQKSERDETKDTEMLKGEVESLKKDVQKDVTELKGGLESIAEEMEKINKMLSSGTNVVAEVDFTPIINKINELKIQTAGISQPQGAKVSYESQAATQGQMQEFGNVFSELKKTISVFDSFELSGRAKVTIDKLRELIQQGEGISGKRTTATNT